MLRIGIVGAGGMGERHASHLERHPEATISRIVEPDPERARVFTDRFGGETCATVDAMLADVDAVYVLTPPRQRVEIIRTLAEAGKAIFCEKPMAVSLEDGEAIVEVVERTQVAFMVGFMRRFSSPMQDLKTLVESGRLGRALQFSRTRMGYLLPPEGNWRIDRSQRCGMAIESVSHDIDLLRWLSNDEITHASGEVIESRAELAGFDDNLVATLRFAGGAVGSLQVSWRSYLEHNSCGVTGDAGAAHVDGPGMWDSQRLRVRWRDTDEDQVTTYGPGTAAEMGFAGETREFLALASGEPSRGATVHDGLATLRVSHDILAASHGR